MQWTSQTTTLSTSTKINFNQEGAACTGRGEEVGIDILQVLAWLNKGNAEANGELERSADVRRVGRVLTHTLRRETQRRILASTGHRAPITRLEEQYKGHELG
jgi:hypothetical protein